jgi:ABC-type multidrug transport system ATPase subunit
MELNQQYNVKSLKRGKIHLLLLYLSYKDPLLSAYDINFPLKQPALSQRNNQVAMEKAQMVSDASSPGLDWHHVTFSVRIGRGKKAYEKVILSDVSGFALRGEVTAIIGPSGSGKTTLMNILTGRVDGKCKISGKILFEGKKRDEVTWKWTVGYVEQFDLMYDSLTCWETLAFSAMTRLPRSYSAAQKLERAQIVLRTLNLEKARDTKVGSDAKRGASGGERKRVAVGCELVTSPKLLCLDECVFTLSFSLSKTAVDCVTYPGTSGLDSHSAFSVISTLQHISRLNVAVLCTIHQPSFEIFSKFDKVILMALGRIAFHGTIPEAIAHFEELGYPLPQGANAADHFIALLTEPGDKEDLDDEERNRVRRFLDVWAEIQEGGLRGRGKVIEEHKSLVGVSDSATDLQEQERRGFGLSYTQELYWLTKRLVSPPHLEPAGLVRYASYYKELTFNLQSMDPTSPFSRELLCWRRPIHLHVHRPGFYFLPPGILTRRRSWPRRSPVLYPYTKHFRRAIPHHHVRANE